MGYLRDLEIAAPTRTRKTRRTTGNGITIDANSNGKSARQAEKHISKLQEVLIEIINQLDDVKYSL